jgi:hypothetical protein
MIAFSETAARPADNRRVYLLQRFNDGAPEAVDVGYRRPLTDPDAIVDARPNVFNELAVQMRLNGRYWLLYMDSN